MKQIGLVLAAACLMAVAAGCVEDQTVLKLNKDGGGTLVQTVALSPQITSMMDGMQAGLGAEGAPAADPLAAFDSDIEKRVADLGPAARLVDKKAVTNAAGWKGYELTVAFDDVTKLQLSMNRKAVGGSEGEEAEEKPAPMKIEFRKGPTAAVSFRADPPAKPADGGTNAVPAQVPDEQQAAAAMAMMAPMLQGMRVSFLVEVDGKIVRTSAQVREGDNRVVLMDMPLGKVLAHAEGSKLIGGGAQDPAIIQKIQALKIEGVVIEDLEKGLTVEFE